MRTDIASYLTGPEMHFPIKFRLPKVFSGMMIFCANLFE